MIKLSSLLREADDVDQKYMREAYLFFVNYLHLPLERMKLIFGVLGIDPTSKQPTQAEVTVKKGTVPKYEIVVRTNGPMSKAEQIRHLAHEMQHVRQVEDGRLNIHSHSWDGVVYSYPTSDVEYRNLPWERDARASIMELELAFNRYMRDKGAAKKVIKI